MPKYAVHVEHYWTYEIEADSPEEAEQFVIAGDAGRGDCTGYDVEAVSWPDDHTREDLREPRQCREGCGKSIPADREDLCLDCLMKRLVALRDAGTAEETR